MESEIWWPLVSACSERGGINKETMASACSAVQEKAAPPVLVLKSENSVLPYLYVPVDSPVVAPALELRASDSISE